MAAGVRSIAIRFLSDTKDLQKAGKDGEKAIGGWKDAFNRLDKTAGRVLLGVGGAITGAVVAMTRSGDEVAKTSRRMGVGAEALQEMRYWADQNGVAHSDLERMVGRLNQRLGDGEAEGNKYVQAIQSLGVATQTSSGEVRAAEDVFQDTVGALMEIESASERSAAAADIFGTRVARQLMPALEDGSMSMEDAAAMAHELGIVMDDEALDASEAFNDALTDLKHAGAGLLRDFAGPFLQILSDDILPVVNDRVIPAIRSMGRWISENSGLVTTIVGVLLGLAAAIKTVTTVVKIFTAVKAALNLVMLASPVTWLVLAIVALIAIIVVLIVYWDDVKEAIKIAWDAIVNAFKAAWDWIKRTFWERGLRRVFDALVSGVQRVRDWFRRAWDRVVDVAAGALQFFVDLPGRIRDGFGRLVDIITKPFRNAFNTVAGLWNRTVGSISFEVPSWVPGLGGRGWSLPKIPTFHGGGVYRAPPGAGGEGLALLRDREVILTPEQADALGGGDVHVTVVVDGQALDDSVVRVMTRRDRRMRRRALTGAGALT